MNMRAQCMLLALALPLAVTLVACAERMPERVAQLDLLVDGDTRREQVVAQFGPDWTGYDGDRIRAYRLSRAAGGYRVHEHPGNGWENVTHSLVLVFDTDGVLRRHALVAVKGD